MSIDWNASAAWAQALLSGLGIFYAVRVGRESDQRGRELVENERTRQASIAAAMISTRLHLLSEEAAKKASFLRDLARQVHGDKVSFKDESHLRELLKLGDHHIRAEFRSWALLFDKECGVNVTVAFDYFDTYNKTINDSCTFFLSTGCTANGFRALLDRAAVRLEEIAPELMAVADQLEEVYGLR